MHLKKDFKSSLEFTVVLLIVSIPIAIEIVVTTTIIYFVVGFHVLNAWGYLVALGIGIASSVIALAAGSLFGMMFVGWPSLSASAVALLTSVAASLAGFYINSRTFPFYIAWLKYFSWCVEMVFFAYSA